MSADPAAPPRLELRGISKSYGSLRANDAISLTIGRGEIHALLGENGAGKSTLMKIVNGAVTADSGEILWNGDKVAINNPSVAQRLGIAMVHQHFALFDQATVAENIALSQSGPLRLRALSARIRELSDHYGMPLDPDRAVRLLSVGERQRVEILRSLMGRPNLLILDEPTAVLAPAAISLLFDMLRRIAAEGCSILYVSHKLEEIRSLCHSATILRGGRVVGTADPAATSTAELARMMVGSAPMPLSHPPGAAQDKPRLEAIGLSAPKADPFGTALDGVSFALRGGEILGIAGVSGNGQAELMALLGGERLAAADMIWLAGEPIGDLGVAERRGCGMAVVPEERLGQATIPDMSLSDNVLLTGRVDQFVRHGLIDRIKVKTAADRIINRFAVACGGAGAPARSLSGGNLQKYIVGREIALAPAILILAQPTWGVDVAAATFIRQSLIDLSRAGAAILVISEDLDELLDLCDRIAVLQRGRLSKAEPNRALDRERIGLLMGGSTL
jgi:simple sugar transport system ATP-binding protein